MPTLLPDISGGFFFSLPFIWVYTRAGTCVKRGRPHKCFLMNTLVFLMLNTDQIKTQMKTNVLVMLTFVCLCSV